MFYTVQFKKCHFDNGCKISGFGRDTFKTFFGETIMKLCRVKVITILVSMMISGHVCANAKAGKLAFEKSVCTGCHAIDIDGFGPKLTAIGKKYGGVVGAKEKLTKKIKAGSSGTWGKYTMPPMGNSLISNENLDAILDFVLTLK